MILLYGLLTQRFTTASMTRAVTETPWHKSVYLTTECGLMKLEEFSSNTELTFGVLGGTKNDAVNIESCTSEESPHSNDVVVVVFRNCLEDDKNPAILSGQVDDESAPNCSGTLYYQYKGESFSHDAKTTVLLVRSTAMDTMTRISSGVVSNHWREKRMSHHHNRVSSWLLATTYKLPFLMCDLTIKKRAHESHGAFIGRRVRSHVHRGGSSEKAVIDGNNNAI
ncbi:hypothetical protein PsorP6_001644 [Peronosclerospora sorghi]|uniref:Uncharacterized protein n=1 Tax=Peronosclerospora sorghi TaxID=230839 RepID=A0ACC0WSJ4_9STRA|nr:hypothetical protein PsorP6_001644 [Peronosclerospora sorghi]